MKTNEEVKKFYVKNMRDIQEHNGHQTSYLPNDDRMFARRLLTVNAYWIWDGMMCIIPDKIIKSKYGGSNPYVFQKDPYIRKMGEEEYNKAIEELKKYRYLHIEENVMYVYGNPEENKHQIKIQ